MWTAFDFITRVVGMAAFLYWGLVLLALARITRADWGLAMPPFLVAAAFLLLATNGFWQFTSQDFLNVIIRLALILTALTMAINGHIRLRRRHEFYRISDRFLGVAGPGGVDPVHVADLAQRGDRGSPDDS